jgi:hypothetical protein
MLGKWENKSPNNPDNFSYSPFSTKTSLKKAQIKPNYVMTSRCEYWS